MLNVLISFFNENVRNSKVKLGVSIMQQFLVCQKLQVILHLSSILNFQFFLPITSWLLFFKLLLFNCLMFVIKTYYVRLFVCLFQTKFRITFHDVILLTDVTNVSFLFCFKMKLKKKHPRMFWFGLVDNLNSNKVFIINPKTLNNWYLRCRNRAKGPGNNSGIWSPSLQSPDSRATQTTDQVEAMDHLLFW